MLSANCVLGTVYTILHVWINLILPQTLYIGYHYYLHFIDDENGGGMLKTVELLSLVGLVDLTPQSALLTSVEFSYSVVSNSLWTYGLQHVRFPCLSRTPGACSNSCLSVMPSSSIIPFSSCLQSFPASGSYPMSQFFATGSQSIGVSASASVLSMNIQDWSPLGWTGWISFQSKELSRVFSNTIVQKHQFFGAQLSLWSNSQIHTQLLNKL